MKNYIRYVFCQAADHLMCPAFNVIEIFLTNAVPSYIQRIQVNTFKYFRVTQSGKIHFNALFGIISILSNIQLFKY